MLKYVPGSKMGKADSLSRRPDWEIGVEKDNGEARTVRNKKNGNSRNNSR